LENPGATLNTKQTNPGATLNTKQTNPGATLNTKQTNPGATRHNTKTHFRTQLFAPSVKISFVTPNFFQP